MKQTKYLVMALTAVCFAAPTWPAAADHKDDESKATRASSASESGGFGQIERANKLIGKAVMTSDGQKVGKVNNAVVDLESGRILYAIVSVGGVAGVGGDNYAVPPGAVAKETAEAVTLKIDKQKLQGAPRFTDEIDKPEQLGQASFVHSVHQHFGQSPWWQGSKPADEGSFNNVHKLTSLSGMKVVDVNDRTFAKVKNSMVDLRNGRVAYVILSPDSSLKLGTDYYAIPPNSLTLSSDKEHLVTGITTEQLASAPHFDENGWATIRNATYASRIYSHYGKQPYFQGGALQPTGR